MKKRNNSWLLQKNFGVKSLFVFVIVLFSTNLNFAQGTNLKLTLNNGTEISNVFIDSLSGSKLYIQSLGRTNALQVESIDEFRVLKKSNFGTGALIGGAIGCVTGMLVAMDNGKNNGLFDKIDNEYFQLQYLVVSLVVTYIL